MFKTHLFIWVLLLFAYSAVGKQLKLELLPSGRPFHLTFADPREIRMALLFEGSAKIRAAVGNYFSIFALTDGEPEGLTFHLGLEGAGYFDLRHQDSRFPLESTDGLIGIYTEAKKGIWQFQLRYTHISAHLSDGSSDTPIAYSREFLSSRVGVGTPNFHSYFGLSYIANSTPDVSPLGAQIGITYFLPWHLSKLTPFAASDLKWKAESEINPSFSFQIGVALNNPPRAYQSFRFFYTYYTGTDPRGQFFDRALTYHAFGVEMQI